MIEPPRSGLQRHRNILPVLLFGGFVCLAGWAGSPLWNEETRDRSPATEPAAATLDKAPTSSGPAAPAADSGKTGQSTAVVSAVSSPAPATSRILVRQPGQVGAAEAAWKRSLKPRAVLAKRTPTSPPGRVHRLIVKFADSLEARANAAGTLTVTAGDPAQITALTTLAENLQLRFHPLQTASETSLDALRKRAALRTGRQQPDPLSVVEVLAMDSSPETILAAADALLPLAAVEYAEIESEDAPPPPPTADASPATPCLISYQTYRQASHGIGVDYVWETHGIRGDSSLRITDCEYQFNPMHEDLDGLITLQPGVASMYSGYGANHGTAVTGIIAAGDNAYGMSGAVQNCQVHFYPEYAAMEGGYTQVRTAAITAAIAASAPGDIVMLEMQTAGPTGGYGPAEYQSSVWNAVKMGSDAGVIIIAASGNDRQNLDDSAWAEYRSRGDSGAIIVGAGSSTRSRLSFSSYGSRVNLQGWGTGVATTGYGTLVTTGNDSNQAYTSTFNGTSSATPIVASAAALIQSVAINKLGTRLSPAEMRALLVATGNPQTGTTTTRIGPLPDLTAAVPQLLATEFSSSDIARTADSAEITATPVTAPPTVHVSGVDGVVSSVRVRIDGLNHAQPQNLDILLVGPGGQVATLLAGAGGTYALTDTMLMFDDAAPTAGPTSSAIVPGRYQPATSLKALAADGANGDWQLCLADKTGCSASITSWSVSFETLPIPAGKIAVATSDGLTPDSGGTVDFGSRVIGTEPATFSFTVRNTGGGPLNDLLLSLDGDGNAAFTADNTALPASLEPDAECTFTVSFSPSASGPFAATLSIASSDPDSPSFQLVVSGTGQTAREAYDEWLEASNVSNPEAPPAAASSGPATPNLLRYAFNLDHAGPNSRSLTPGAGIAGMPCSSCDQSGPIPIFRLEYLRRKNTGLRYAALQMQDPGKGPRSPMAGTSHVTPIDSVWERVTIEQAIDPATPRLFFTVEVTLPDAAP